MQLLAIFGGMAPGTLACLGESLMDFIPPVVADQIGILGY